MVAFPKFGENKVDFAEHFKDKASELDTREEVDKLLLVEAMKKALSTLTEREQKILFLRFYKGFSTKDMCGFFNTSRERIRIIELKGLRKLRLPTGAKLLCQFLSSPRQQQEIEAEVEAIAKRSRRK